MTLGSERLDTLSPVVPLRVTISETTPPPEVTAVDLGDDGKTARVVYTCPSEDPEDPANQGAIENLAAAYVAVLDQSEWNSTGLAAVGMPPDGGDAPRLTWHVDAAWVERLLSGEWDPLDLVHRIAETSDTIIVTD